MGEASTGADTSARTLFAFLRKIKAPTAGQLREPVSFFHSERVPDASTGFEQKITPFHDAFAYIWQNQEALLNGQNTENLVSHVLLVRNFPGFVLETRDYAVWDGKNLSIRGTRNIEGDTLRRWLVVLCEQEGLFAEEPRDNTKTPEDAANEPPPADPKNPLWI